LGGAGDGARMVIAGLLAMAYADSVEGCDSFYPHAMVLLENVFELRRHHFDAIEQATTLGRLCGFYSPFKVVYDGQ